jgi:hypothetical protein
MKNGHTPLIGLQKAWLEEYYTRLELERLPACCMGMGGDHSLYTCDIEIHAKKNVENAWVDNMLYNVCHLQKLHAKI